MEYIVLAVILIVGMAINFFVGILVGTNRMRKAIEDSSVGYLRIDQSEPDEPPKPFLEVRKGVTIDDIAQKKVVMLGVINESYISQN